MDDARFSQTCSRLRARNAKIVGLTAFPASQILRTIGRHAIPTQDTGVSLRDPVCDSVTLIAFPGSRRCAVFAQVWIIRGRKMEILPEALIVREHCTLPLPADRPKTLNLFFNQWLIIAAAHRTRRRAARRNSDESELVR
jgi:hypothetical protein